MSSDRDARVTGAALAVIPVIDSFLAENLLAHLFHIEHSDQLAALIAQRLEDEGRLT